MFSAGEHARLWHGSEHRDSSRQELVGQIGCGKAEVCERPLEQGRDFAPREESDVGVEACAKILMTLL